MNNVDTLSRGRRPLLTWVLVTAALMGMFVVVRLQASAGVDAHIDAAQDRAVSHAAVIAGAVESRPGSTDPAFNPRTLTTLIQAQVFDDPTVARVRVYDPAGVLLFATDQDVRPGDIQAPTEDPGVTSAASGAPYRSIVDSTFTWSTIGGEPLPAELLQTFEPLRVPDRFASAGAVQIDFFMDDLRGAAISEADGTLTVIAILALLSLMAAVLTYRHSARGGPEVPGKDAPEGRGVELSLLRAKLKTAEGRRATAERSLEETRAELTVAKQASVEATQRVRTLEAELAAAAAVAERATAASSPATGPDPATVRELEELRRRLADAEARVTDAEAAAVAARGEAEAAQAAARNAAATPGPVYAPAPAANNGATGGKNGASDDLLHRLEARIAAAEQRAKDAEERIDRLAPLSDEATDLRARLAKTAARKRLGPSGGESDPES